MDKGAQLKGDTIYESNYRKPQKKKTKVHEKKAAAFMSGVSTNTQ